jgi:hypothetical protein
MLDHLYEVSFQIILMEWTGKSRHNADEFHCEEQAGQKVTFPAVTTSLR